MNGIEIYHRQWLTETSGKASIVIVHGQGEHSGRYEYTANALNARGFDIYTGDLPGQGRSGGLRGHVDRYDDYLAAVDGWVREARDRSEGRPLFLLGHSVGGLVVTRYLQTAPDTSFLSGVVLSSPAYRVRYPIPRWKEALGLRLDKVLPRLRMPSGLEKQRTTKNEEIAQATAQDPLMEYLVSIRLFNEMLRAQVAAIAEADRIRLPLLLLHGGADEIIDPQQSLEFGRRLGSTDKDVRLLPGLHHEILNEPERDDVIREIADWLERRIHNTLNNL